ncbi:MAG: rRNA maturation RNase YbeY [Saprospiraceae bacterium]|nr:rRNA maturation RNase YbeY [Saprospiraceae bacterium]
MDFPSFDTFQEESSISFESEDVDFELPNSIQIVEWLKAVCSQEGGNLQALNYIFCSDDYLHRINMEYLDHDTLTDIITFPYDSFPSIYGDLFISIERVKENADELNIPFEQELRRVIVHGLLHLHNYSDKTEAEEQVIRKKEDDCLLLWEQQFSAIG